MAARTTRGEDDRAGTGGRSGDFPGAGVLVVDGVSAEQEHVDQFVCAGGGGLLACGADRVLPGGGWAGLGQGAQRGSHLSRTGAGRPFDHRVYVQRTGSGTSGADSLSVGRQGDKSPVVAGIPCVHPHADAGMAGVRVLILYAGVLLHSGVDPVQEEDLYKGIAPVPGSAAWGMRSMDAADLSW